MKTNLLFICLLVCLIFFNTSCSRVTTATQEQIGETEKAIKKEQFLEEMHESEVRKLVHVLENKAKDGEGFYWLQLDNKTYEQYKGYPYINIVDQRDKIVIQLKFNEIKELPEYKELSKLHIQYHTPLWKKTLTECSEEEWDLLWTKELRKWVIEDGKIQKSLKGVGYHKTIENTVCPFCWSLIEEDYAADYVYEYKEENHPAYQDEIKLFGYYLKHPEQITDFDNELKYFKATQLPLYTLYDLIAEYSQGLDKAKAKDEFEINGEVSKYNKSWNGKVVRVKAKIEDIEKRTLDERLNFDETLKAEEKPLWKITLKDGSYQLTVYFDRNTTSTAKMGGFVPTDEDIISLKKGDEITIVTELYTGGAYESCMLFPLSITKLHLGYSEILEIN